MRDAWRYIGEHWRGDHSLLRATFVNFLPLFYLFWYALEPLVQSIADDAVLAYTVIAVYCVVAFVIVLPWQAMGVMRSCERYLLNHGNPVWARVVQAVVLAAALGAVIAAVGAVQRVGARQNEMAFDRLWREKTTRVYDIARVSNLPVAHLRGDLQNGTTRVLETWLDERPDIEGIVLDSIGGRVYEGRGVARLVTERGLDTYTLTGCYSACTTAFIAGEKRFLADGAKLGFHQYRYDSSSNLGYLDSASEQEKDRAWYRGRGIDKRFLDRVFDTPGDDMWYPSYSLLLEYGVVHAIIDPSTLAGER